MDTAAVLLLFVVSGTRRIVSQDPLTPPEISLDQPTGVYVVGETVTLTCTVTGDYRHKTFYFYGESRMLYSIQFVTKGNIGRFPVTGTNLGGRFQCRYKTSVNGLLLESQLSEIVTVTVAVRPPPPGISLDQPTGVYLKGEMITINCAVPAEYLGERYRFYKDNQWLNSSQIVTMDNIGTFWVTGANQGGRYRCTYRTFVKGRWLLSHFSEAVTVTKACLPKPNLSVDSGVVVKGGEVTLNCTSPRDFPDFTFHLYSHGEANYTDVQPAASGNNFVTFTIRNIDHAKGGNYTCLCQANVRGRRLISALSDPVHITVREKSVALVAGVGCAVGLILILVLLGVCFWKKEMCIRSREMRTTAPPSDQNNDNVTYAVLNLQAQPRRTEGQRDTVQTLGENSTIYAVVNL